ncbi:uncharacterized protein LOC143886571 isoform X2 [Tasmannia lanceolata]|uniref:uncharacterized protein LOC143886571 isoform X2 n=1 Tax=Tasmannia lanceolata TaxID=3420 RepID=UPI004062FB9F
MRGILKRRGIEEIWQREVGELSPRTFAHRVGASTDLVLRLDIHKKLDKHRGCVNTISFNDDGNILVSGSDDRMIMLWNWDAGVVKLAFHSGHINNVFQAKMMPYTGDRTIVTCAADGQVRLAQLQEGGRVDTVNLAWHEGRVHKLAIEPGSPHIFYSCGEDGLVQHFDLRTRTPTKLFTCHNKPTYLPIVQLNAIAIDPRNPNRFAIAGSDAYARVYDIRKYKLDGSTNYDHPTDYFCRKHLIGVDQVWITGLAFSDQSELLVSYSNELIYLFTRDLGLGPDPCSTSESSFETSLDIPGPQVYEGHMNCDTVKGVGFFGPNSEYVVSGSDCGRIFIWRKKDSELLRAMEADKDVVNCTEPHPHATILASSGIDHDVKIWTPKATEPATLPVNLEENKLNSRKLQLRFSSLEDVITQIFSLQRRSSNLGRSGEDSEESAALVEYIMGFTDGDGASDDNGDRSGQRGV